MRTRTMARAVVLIPLVGLGLALGAPAAFAHAQLRSSVPASGERLDAAPREIRLTFSESPESSLARIQVLDAAGGEHQTGSPRAVPGQSRTLEMSVGSLADGIYTVGWRVVSATDGHATAGSFVFGVGVDPAGAKPSTNGRAPTTPGVSPVEIAARWLFLLGLVGLVGGTAASLFSLGGATPAVRGYLWSALALAVVGLVVLSLAQRANAGVGFAALLRTAVGRALEWRAAALAAAAAGLASARGRAIRGGLGAACAAGVAAILVHVDAGHAAAAQTLRLGKVASQWIHFTAVSLWIGGLAALLLGIRGEPNETRARAVRRFSTLAGVALVAVVVTGTIRAVNEVGTWHALFASAYGRVILVKVGLLGLLVALGAANRYRNVPRAAHDLGGLRRVSRVEIAVAVAILAATALLTSLAPASSLAGAAAARGPSGLVATGADFGTTVRVRLTVSPGDPGSNAFSVRVTDYDSGAPIRGASVRLDFAFAGGSVGPSRLELAETAPGTYAARGPNLSLSGRWTVTVTIQETATAVEVPLEIVTRCRTQALVAAGQPTIYTITLPGGRTAQGYVDVGQVDEVHVTFFDAQGNELPIQALPSVTASRGTGEPPALDVRRFSAGHFVADGQLDVGRWRFDFSARDRSGAALVGCFEDTVAPA